MDLSVDQIFLVQQLFVKDAASVVYFALSRFPYPGEGVLSHARVARQEGEVSR